MAIDPGSAAPTRTRTLVARLWRDGVSRHASRFLGALGLMAVVAAADAAYPPLISWAVGNFNEDGAELLYYAPLIVLVLTAIKGTASYGHAVLMESVALRTVRDLRRAMFAHLTFADLATVSSRKTASLASRFTNDMTVLKEAIARTATNLVRDVLTLCGYFGFMIYSDWVLTLIVLGVFPIAGWPIAAIGRRLRRTSADSQDQLGEMTALLHESFSGARLVKSHNLEAYETARAHGAFQKLYEIMMRAARSRARVDPTMEVLGGVAVGCVIAVGGWRVASGDGSLPAFAGFVSAVLLAARPLRAIGTLSGALQEGLAAAQRTFDLLDERSEVQDRPGAAALERPNGRVELAKVDFRYGTDAPALNAVSLEAHPGEMVALVGPSGAGKSTIFGLIPRFFDVTSGVVRIDGRDVRDVTLHSLRESIAVVSQDTMLFHDTVRANIAFGRLDADDKAIEEAARAAAAHGFIVDLPQGYATVVGERGFRLSGGERQRIALARAILKDAPILLLDEATSALDAESERLVAEALQGLTKGRTTLAIAHRLSTVRDADRIYVLDGGRVVEFGDHASLQAKGGLYAKLCRIQFRDAA